MENKKKQSGNSIVKKKKMDFIIFSILKLLFILYYIYKINMKQNKIK